MQQLKTLPETEAADWLRRYGNYLDQVVGTTASTRQHYCLVVRQFLNNTFGLGHVDWSILNAQILAENALVPMIHYWNS